jgi:transketolase
MMEGSLKSRQEFDDLCINTIRTLSMDAVQKANSGHPGAPMGLAPAAYVLWRWGMKYNPKNPKWPDRDRFILSGGHASMLLYSMLHITGYSLGLEDIRQFRQWGSITPGHPEFRHTPGVETTTGPLGQGFANAVGMAMAERHLAARFNRPGYEIVDHFTYVMCGDGDMMEGISSEAASLAGHLGLGKLIVIYDDNKVSIEGPTDLTFTEDVAMRFSAYHWGIYRVDDGNNLDAIRKVLSEAKADESKPSLILLRTHIAYGSPNKQDSSEAHGAPLGAEEVALTKKRLGWNENEPFFIPHEVESLTRECIETGESMQSLWEKRWVEYQKKFPELAQAFSDALDQRMPAGWDEALPVFPIEEKSMATRSASGKVLNALGKRIPSLIGGSADLAPSNNTLLSFSQDFQKNSYHGRNIRFGVREHAMAAILSGMTLHGGLRPYGGTFLVFADYMRPSIRLAALMKIPVIYVFTHDSVAVGEDGPTHQPVEHLASLRSIPGLCVIRPADANETSQAWRCALERTQGPTAIILSRQKLPVIDQMQYAKAESLSKGAYILLDCIGDPDLIVVASGSEVSLVLQASEILSREKITVRVISMPSWELFEQMPEDYRNAVLPRELPVRLIVEAGSRMGWERYKGEKGEIFGISRFGASAPGEKILKEFGFSAPEIAQRARELLLRARKA